MILINSIFKILFQLLPYAFAAVCFIVILKLTIKNIRLLNAIKVTKYMPYTCSQLGYVINLSGKPGVGKTTTGAGITNYLIKYIQMKMMKEMDNIRKSLSEIDFNVLEKDFIETLENSNFDENLAFKKVLDAYSFNTLYTDNLHIFNKKEMLQDYLKRFWILNFRQRYVLSKTYFFDCVNGQNALQLDPSSLELLKVEERRNYQLDIATVIFEDEKQFGSGNVFSNNKEVKTSGKKEQRSLIRNAYEGLVYEVTTKQYDMDEIKLERKGISSSLNIRSRREINYSIGYIKLLKLIYNLMIFPYQFVFFFHNYDEKLDRLKKKSNFLRKLEKKIDDYEKIIKSDGFIVVYARSYFDPDDVGKQNKELYENVKLIFEKELCYGSIYTHEYKTIANYYKNFNENAIYETTSIFDEKLKLDVWNKSVKR